MKRLAVIAACLLAVAACKPKDTGSTMSDSTSTATPAMSPAPADTGMKKDTSMKMNADTGMKSAAPAMKDTTKKGKKM